MDYKINIKTFIMFIYLSTTTTYNNNTCLEYSISKLLHIYNKYIFTYN